MIVNQTGFNPQNCISIKGSTQPSKAGAPSSTKTAKVREHGEMSGRLLNAGELESCVLCGALTRIRLEGVGVAGFEVFDCGVAPRR